MATVLLISEGVCKCVMHLFLPKTTCYNSRGFSTSSRQDEQQREAAVE